MNLQLLEEITLKSGGHQSREAGMCVMEAAAYIAGEPHSDHPSCTSEVIAAFMRSWNDSLSTDEDRDRLLKPLLPKIIGTRVGGHEADQKRAWMAMDWLAREHLPAWLELAGVALSEHAAALKALPEITDSGALDAARPVIDAARSAAAAARDAAWDAAWAAARDAAGAAARDAAGVRLAPTVARLQESAVALVERMAAVGVLETAGAGAL